MSTNSAKTSLPCPVYEVIRPVIRIGRAAPVATKKDASLSLTRGIQRRSKPLANGSFHLRKSTSKLLDITCCKKFHISNIAEIF
jgi:hypothetical protein